ncbi:MAG TPA: phosphatase PAP2 family protein [Thermoanaerobaculia bacterium]|nr:phosphatase PAP2 family protein [Thermoanaerobaculia bacterium]
MLSVISVFGLVTYAGFRALGRIDLSEENYWDFSLIVFPAALLIFLAALHYAFAPRGESSIRSVWVETGTVIRDWLPFLIFLLTYESFRVRTWGAISPVDADPFLLKIDRWLFGETPAVVLDPYARAWITQPLTIAYFLHLVLPPVLAMLWYRRDLLIFRQFLLTILVAGMIGSIGYIAVPAVGPGVAFPNLFHHKLSGEIYGSVTEFLDSARAMRDAFPSLHIGLSTIVLYYAWLRDRVTFAWMLPLIVGNWISTIYLRYHYMIDVIAGFVIAYIGIVVARWALRAETAINEWRALRAAQ